MLGDLEKLVWPEPREGLWWLLVAVEEGLVGEQLRVRPGVWLRLRGGCSWAQGGVPAEKRRANTQGFKETLG